MAGHGNFINLWQTNEDRRAKYWLVRSLGKNSYWANAMRDWRLAKIERLFGLERSNKFQPEADRAKHHQLHLPFMPKPKILGDILS